MRSCQSGRSAGSDSRNDLTAPDEGAVPRNAKRPVFQPGAAIYRAGEGIRTLDVNLGKVIVTL
jgi:hypothetical protein